MKWNIKLRNSMAFVLPVLFLLCGCSCGCSVSKTEYTKVSDVEYVIAEESELPEELHELIDQKKAADFKLTYEKDGELYIARGYGEQATGGYSIRVKDFYLTKNALLFDTELIGPHKGEQTSTDPSYPFIVIKTDAIGETVIFD